MTSIVTAVCIHVPRVHERRDQCPGNFSGNSSVCGGKTRNPAWRNRILEIGQVHFISPDH